MDSQVLDLSLISWESLIGAVIAVASFKSPLLPGIERAEP
jgi:hypothetical protein|tara:strand:+ start:697 stop:816 length:120 start_codon:yes stop_codon:yes gene_type:complete